MSGNKQCMAIACKYQHDNSAHVLFYDMTQYHPLKRIGKVIHEGSPIDLEEKTFISISFSSEAR